jgi:hypothetical protein
MNTTILGGPDGPYSIVSPGNGSITCDDASHAQGYCTAADWSEFQDSLVPTYVTWTEALTTFQATTPTVGQLNTWLAANPPVAD